METLKFERISALTHYALGTSKTKVIFRIGGWDNPKGKEKAYWMNKETYNAIPIAQNKDTSPEDYQKHGEVVDARNTDIYDIENTI